MIYAQPPGAGKEAMSLPKPFLLDLSAILSKMA